MKKHSPNFLSNLQEIEQEEVNNERRNDATTFMWILLAIAVFSCVFAKAQTSSAFVSDSLRAKLLIGTVIDNGTSLVQLRKTDTTPVIILVIDTSSVIITDVVFIEQEPDTSNKPNGGYFLINNTKERSRFEAKSFYPHHPIIIIGYEVTTANEPNFAHTHSGGYCSHKIYTATYLNHLKQPLPDRLIVWMVVRRKER